MKFTGEFFVPDDKFEKLSEDRELAIEHLQRYNTILPLVAGKDVLDIASGEGYGSNILAAKAASVTGVDINDELVAHATATYGKTNLNFKTGNVVSIPLENVSVDVVVSFETLEHVSEQEQQRFLREITRVLKKDGILIISTPNKENYSERFHHTNEFHVNELGETEFVSLLKKNFQQVELFNQGQEIVSLVYNKEKYHNRSSVPALPIGKDHYRLQGKYLLAVCGKSDKKQLPDISSVVIEGNKSFFDLTERIVKVQEEVEELGAWGRRSAAEVEQVNKTLAEKNAVISQFNDLMALREKLHQDSESVIRIKNDIIAQLEQLLLLRDKLFQDTEAANKQNQTRLKELEEEAGKHSAVTDLLRSENSILAQTIAKLRTDLTVSEENSKLQLNRISEINKELEEQKNTASRSEIQRILLEQRLQHIYSSEGWKFLSIYYRIKEKLLPENSGRYKTLKKWFQVLKAGKKGSVNLSTQVPVMERPVVEFVPEPVSDINFPVVFPVFDKIEVSIVMPAFNNWEFTRNCLLSIHRFNDGIPFEVIVGDNQSTDDTQRLPEFFTNVNYIRNPENLGYIKNVNNAASKARGKYILTLNNDTTVTEGWLINLVKVLEADPGVGLVGSKLVYPNGSLQEAGGIIWNDASGWNFGRTSDPELPQFNYLKESDYISGASNLIRRELWEKLGGLDTRYVPAYFDDSDLAFSIRELGFKVIYQPLSVVVHYEGMAHGTDVTQGTKQYQLINRQKFIEKWKDELANFHFPNAEKVFWARDRSRNKKTILVVDHYVPHFDKDAGSRTTYQLLQLFVQMNYNVKFIGDNFYKHEPYTTILQQMGIEVLYGAWYRDHWQQWVKENSEMIDFIYLNRPHISIKYIDFFRENTTAKIIYYGHDLHFIREQKQYEIEKDPRLLDSMKEWRQVESYLIQKSNTVFTLSCTEKEIMETELMAPHIKIMPAFFYDEFKEPVTDFANRKDILFIGGFNHKPNVDAVLWFAKEVWPTVSSALKGTKFIIVGSLVPEEVANLASDNIWVRGYITDEELNQLYDSVKIVAIPLRYGGGVKGKTVEAMSKGLPIVTTSFGIEGLENINMVLHAADEANEFASQLITLYNNDRELADLSEKELNYAKTHFSQTVVQNLIAEIFNQNTN